MSGKKRRRSQNADYPGWVWMLFGLAIGLSVALAIYLNDGTPRPVQQARQAATPEPAPVTIDDNGESAATAGDSAEERFSFYDVLPNFEVVIPEQESDVRTDNAPQAVVQPGTYILQAGSFSAHADADRRRAELAMQGIESQIQRVVIDNRTYHRVRIGPIDNLNDLNVLRSRLRQAKIDVLRIRLGD
jgi:cell division protein FtsN